MPHCESDGSLQNEQMLLKREICPNETLDSLITENENKTAICLLKSNKACEPDQITNEMLKFGAQLLLTPMCKFFNSVFMSGLYPKNWSTSYISALHKKGPKTDPDNYRGIAVTSCVRKLYSSILNSRLLLFLDKNLIERRELYNKGIRGSAYLVAQRRRNVIIRGILV